MARRCDTWRLLPIFAVAAGIGAVAVGVAQATNSSCTAKPDPTATPDKIADAKPDDVMRFHFINSGAGLCVLVECPGAKEAVIADCGSTSKRNAMTPAEVFGYLDTYLANKDGYSVVVSHGDGDHYTLLRPYANRDYGVPVAGGKKLLPTRVIYGGGFEDYSCRTKGGNALGGWGRTDDDPKVAVGTKTSAKKRGRNADPDVDEMDEDPDQEPASKPSATKKANVGAPGKAAAPGRAANVDLRARELTKGLIGVMQYFEDSGELDAKNNSARLMPWFACGDAKFYVLTAPRKPDETNPRSVVLGIKYGTFEALLPGDAEGPTESAAFANSNKLRNFGSESVSAPIDLFAAAHHGADTLGSNSDDWVEAAAARVAIFSSGAGSHSAGGKPWMKHGHPKTAIVDKYTRKGAKAPDVACKHAFVQCRSSEDDCELQSARSEAVFSTAASGTIVVDAKADASMVMRFPRKQSPDWGTVVDDDEDEESNLLDGQPKSCTFSAPPPPAPPAPPP